MDPYRAEVEKGADLGLIAGFPDFTFHLSPF
jgi:hypothetical protein